jgi:pimeloyl-ACP methyl ester carboxylesterase
MATFVLVHPAWFGGWCWNRVVPRLRAAGHAAYAPTLTGLGERAHLCAPTVGLSIHIEDVLQVLSFEELDDVVLVGNSSAGTVITGVADRVRERIRRVVYLDAFVPADGQSTFDLIAPERRAVIEGLVESEGYGWLLPRFAPTPWEQFVVEAWQVIDEADLQWVLARLRPTPFRHFTEPLHLRHTDAEQPQRVTSDAAELLIPGFDRFAAAAESSAAWVSREMATAHLPYITDPEELTAMLVELARG